MTTTILKWIVSARRTIAASVLMLGAALQNRLRRRNRWVGWLAVGWAVLCPAARLQAQWDVSGGYAQITVRWTDCNSIDQRFQIYEDYTGTTNTGPQPVFSGWFPDEGVVVQYYIAGAWAVDEGGHVEYDIIHWDRGKTGCQVLTNYQWGVPSSYTISKPQRSGSVSLWTKATSGSVSYGVSAEIQILMPGDVTAQAAGVPAPQTRGCCGSTASGATPALATARSFANGLDFRFHHGRASFFLDGAHIALSADVPSTSLATPAALSVPFARTNVTVIPNAGVLAQTVTPLGLMNVQSNSAYEYQLQFFYTNSVGGQTNGLYTTNAPAFATWVVSNPDTSTASNRLSITEVRDGVTNGQYQYTYSNTSNQANRWDLLQADLQTILSTWQTTNANSLITNYCTQVTLGTNIVSYRSVSLLYVPGITNVLTNSVTEGSGTATQTTTYTYYTNNSPAGTLSSNQLQRIDYPDGGWIYYMYDDVGRLTYQFSACLNYPPPAIGTQPDPLVDHCKQTAYSYASQAGGADDGTDFPSRARLVTVSLPIQVATNWQLQEVSRILRSATNCYAEQQVCPQPGAPWGDPGNLRTLQFTYPNSTNDVASSGRPQSISNPDGTATVYFYQHTATNFTTITCTGMPDNWARPSNILYGTQTTTVIDQLGRTVSSKAQDLVGWAQRVLSQDTYAYLTNDSSLGQSYTVTDLAGRTTTYTYACCGLESVLDPDSVTTQHIYDTNKNEVATLTMRGSANYLTHTNVLDGLGRVLASQRIGTNGDTITLAQYQYDALGRVAQEMNALGGVTTHDYAVVSNQACLTNTYPDGGTRIEVYHRDGRLASISGTAVSPVQYQYGIEQDTDGTWRQFTLEIKPDSQGSTSEWTKTYTDGAGRAYKTLYAAASGAPCSISYYNANGQLTNTIDPDGISTLYAYNPKGEQVLTVIDMNQDHLIDWSGAGADRITFTINDLTTDGVDCRRTRVYAWDTSDNTSNLVSTALISCSGLFAESWPAWNWQNACTWSVMKYGANGSRWLTNIAPDNSYTVSAYLYGLLVSVTRYDCLGTNLGGTTYDYDPHYRQFSVSDALNGATTSTFNNADQVVTVTTPGPGSGQAAQVTTTYYDTSLRATNIVQPDGTSVTNVYDPRGLLLANCGSRTYPVACTYDAQGRMKTMTTWQNCRTGAGAATTTWNYDIYRGWLTNKTYNGGASGPVYTYTPAGRLKTRTWARGVTTTYTYDNAGGLSGVAYSDSTPALTCGYDRLGRLAAATSGTNVTLLSYNYANQLVCETNTAGLLAGVGLVNWYDQHLRRSASGPYTPSGGLGSRGYTYDKASRLQTVLIGNGTQATNIYLANSPLVGQVVFVRNGVTRMTTTRQYDALNRLTQISSVNGSQQVVASGAYGYNSANQRTSMTNADGSYWLYGYDSLGQLTNAHKYWTNGTLVAGQQFQYQFDTIGNRTGTDAAGDQIGTNLRHASYTLDANNLNQYASRDVPGCVQSIGTASSNANVALWSTNGSYAQAVRKGTYFRAELPVANGTGPLWLALTNMALLPGGSGTDVLASASGHLYVPQTPEQFTYDADGNLLSDGRWTYTWDAENRLINMTSLSNAPAGSKLMLDFTYDWKGRRIQKLVWAWNASAYVPASTNLFVYDGWNMVGILGYQGAFQSALLWGLDLSGSEQGAGGVGGLLEITDPSYYGGYFAAYDGNGNLTALVNAVDGSTAALYEYGPFGEVIRATGPMAKANPLRFSTKYQDDQTDLLYYGYRYYNAGTGRWLSTDPVDEPGFALLAREAVGGDVPGLNLYAYVNNSPLGFYDPLGLAANWHHLLPQEFEAIFKAANLDVDAAEFGVILDAECHTGRGALHPEWNNEWRKFFGGKPNATKGQILAQLSKMKKDSRFASILASGPMAKLGYRAWLTEARRVRNRAIREALEKGGKKLTKHVAILGLVFVIDDINRKGFLPGITCNVVDQVPWLGWGKFATECVWGDWFPDKGTNEN